MGNRLSRKDQIREHPMFGISAYLNCALCGTEFAPEEDEQRYCSENCETDDKKIDQAEILREEREQDYDKVRKTFRGRNQRGGRT